MKVITLGILIAVTAAVGAGCDRKREPVAVSIAVNPTATAGERRERGNEHLKPLFRGLPKGSVIQIVRDDCNPKVIYEGPVIIGEVSAAYEEALTDGKNCGNDVRASLDMQRAWLVDQKYRGFKKLIITGWDDLRSENCRAVPGKIRRFPSTQTMKWPGAKDIDVVIFGVAPSRARELEKKWGPQLRSCRLFGPAHRITIADLGLSRNLGM